MAKTERDGDGTPSVETILTHSGRQPDDNFGFVNTPVFRGSTVLFKTLDDLDNYKAPFRYGRNTNPTFNSVTSLLNELEGAEGTVDPSPGADLAEPLDTQLPGLTVRTPVRSGQVIHARKSRHRGSTSYPSPPRCPLLGFGNHRPRRCLGTWESGGID